VLYFLLSCWAAGTQISCGLVVPMLLIGALYGRLLGRAVVDIFGVHDDDSSMAAGAVYRWDWMDPGAFALLGAVSFFAGVTRLTMSLAVIMVEITNDIQFLLLIMTTIMFSKWIGDLFTHSIYHSLLELKCIPFLEANPVFYKTATDGGKNKAVSLEQFSARCVMASPVVHLTAEVELERLVQVLQTTDHGGFPIVEEEGGGLRFQGLVTRFELMTLLCRIFTSRQMAAGEEDPATWAPPEVSYAEFMSLRGHKLTEPQLTRGMLDQIKSASGRSNRSTLDIRRFHASGQPTYNYQKGTVTRQFRPLVFSIKQTHLDPCFIA
jgi:CBS domain-containing protein